MSQNDFNIANQGFPATRADINSALQALASNSSGATSPGTTYAYQWWYDETTDILKIRNADNNAWISIAEFDQTADTWQVLGDFETLVSTNISDGTLSIPTTYVTNGSAKAWASVTSTGGTTTGLSLNVSSVVDNGPGDSTVNFTNALQSQGTVASALNINSGLSDIYSHYARSNSASSVLLNQVQQGVGKVNQACSFSVWGDLA